MRCIAFLILTMLFGMFTIGHGAAEADSSARKTVESFHDVLLNTMKEAIVLKPIERYRHLEAKVHETFDLAFMIRLITGRYWRQATVAQKKALFDVFARMSVATYVHHFNSYSGEVFQTIKEAPGPSGTTLVKTHIISPDGSKTNLTYVVKQTKKGNRVVNVILAEKISELALRRSEYAAILNAEGLEGLIRQLTERTKELLNE